MTEEVTEGVTPLAESVATRVLLALTGYRWTWPRRRVLEEYWVPETVNSVNLAGRPVSAVYSAATRGGTSFEFELADKFRLRFPALDRQMSYPYDVMSGVPYYGYPRCGGLFMRIDYLYGSPPPSDVARAIHEFAVELDNAMCGRECKLPERVTSVSREGVNWTVLDPQQFLEGGKLGMYYPDLIISTYGNKVRARARVWSPEYRPPRRLSSVLVPAGEGVLV